MNDKRDTTWPTALCTTAAFTFILGLLVLAGCESLPKERIVTKTVERKIDVPPSLLECMPEPQARELWKTQRDMVLFMERLALAGQDCRTRLGNVKKLLAEQ